MASSERVRQTGVRSGRVRRMAIRCPFYTPRVVCKCALCQLQLHSCGQRSHGEIINNHVQLTSFPSLSFSALLSFSLLPSERSPLFSLLILTCLSAVLPLTSADGMSEHEKIELLRWLVCDFTRNLSPGLQRERRRRLLMDFRIHQEPF